MEFNTSCLEGCSPPQVININYAINDISTDIDDENDIIELEKIIRKQNGQ